MLGHYELGLITLVLAVVATITGFVILGNRHGYGPTGTARTLNRWAHIVLGVLLLIFVILTYLITPPQTIP
ncbi:hypothetical protein [Natrialbaceae archaeon AArc-T1-2]|uniref:hypothetical protein n=1 Tax=Natrialbaceae archaeon AArc-T1-2 TaxID=3053904 RepID=UPI00255AD962|nr:hypothetical protein [Natrialbaceae archaeon AArc-T1-2]WIV67607.1 hypothetical protein QQ977_02425 [Natrialbaceae archaeon AArc-T1-2]